MELAHEEHDLLLEVLWPVLVDVERDDVEGPSSQKEVVGLTAVEFLGHTQQIAPRVRKRVSK